MPSLSSRIALVTGAGSGIGEAAARRLAAEGAAVVLAGRRTAELDRVAAAIRAVGGRAEAVACDVRKPMDCKRAAAKAAEAFSGLDILVNNAGILKRLPLLSTDLASWEDQMATNATGAFLMTQACAPLMVPRGGGSIVNVGTVAAVVGIAGLSAYGASKGALVAFTRAAAVELGPRKIRVNAVCPAAVETSMAEAIMRDAEARASLAARHPIGRYGRPEDVAEAILWLASDASSWATGSVLMLDGGLTAV